MLVHICCSVDSHYFLQKLQELYPKEKLIGFFYDPNIHPYSEYQLRLLDVQRSCKKLNIPLIEGEYDYKKWLEVVKGFENEPEKGKRCSICFDNRIQNSAKKAKELNQTSLTTTLLTSPKKSIEQLKDVGEKICENYSIKFISPDFRKNGGTQEQFALAKKDNLYHQNYCGCIYALNIQREQQNRFKDELSSTITKQIQPSSIEERLILYKKIIDLEEKNIPFQLKREKFLNYRLKYAYIKENNQILDSYFLAYSTLNRSQSISKIEDKIDNIYYMKKDDIRILSIKTLNNLLGKKYKSTRDLNLNPPKFNEEISLKKKITNIDFSLSCIIIVDKLESNSKYKIICESEIYPDFREYLISFR
jgi:predicted adenine nucleotide alpha hydrolase (AANH) superfamily ATPase